MSKNEPLKDSEHILAEMIDSLDEELDLELDSPVFNQLMHEISENPDLNS